MSTKTKWHNAAAGCLVVAAISMLAGCGGNSSLPKPEVSISTEPDSIVRGSYAVIRWSTTGATECSADGAWGGARAINGTEEFLTRDAGPNKLKLHCTGPGGSTTSTAILTVYRGVSPTPERGAAR
jgi:hypothetical protein